MTMIAYGGDKIFWPRTLPDWVSSQGTIADSAHTLCIRVCRVHVHTRFATGAYVMGSRTNPCHRMRVCVSLSAASLPAPYGPGPNQFQDCYPYGCGVLSWVQFKLLDHNGSFAPPTPDTTVFIYMGQLLLTGESVVALFLDLIP